MLPWIALILAINELISIIESFISNLYPTPFQETVLWISITLFVIFGVTIIWTIIDNSRIFQNKG